MHHYGHRLINPKLETRNSKLKTLVFLSFLALLVAACSPHRKMAAMDKAIQSPLPKEATFVTALVAEGANVWLPSVLVVNSGEEITLTLRNVAKVEHGFAIDGLNVQEILAPDQTKVVSFKAERGGTFRFYCPLHKGHIGGQMMVRHHRMR